MTADMETQHKGLLTLVQLLLQVLGKLPVKLLDPRSMYNRFCHVPHDAGKDPDKLLLLRLK